MLPKISDRVSHNQLVKQLGIACAPPEKLSQHRDVFAQIVSQTEDADPWRCDVLYFPKSWVKKLKLSAGNQLRTFFANIAWSQSYNCRRQFENNIFWEDFLQTISQSNIYFQPKICSHLKQLLLISEGIFPGMVFSSSDNEQIAPVELIQSAYTEVYKLKQYAPILMYPQHVSDMMPVYYSLNYPNYFDPYLPMKAQPRLSDDLRALIIGLGLVLDKAAAQQHTAYQVFHAIPHEQEGIHPSAKILDQEENLRKTLQQFKNKEFPTNSPFFKGCIRIGKDRS